MMDELFYHPAVRESDNPALPLLVAFSIVRDDFPWLYELAVQLSRAIQRRNLREIQSVRKSIMVMMDMIQHGPMSEMLGLRDDESMMMLRSLMHLVEEHLPDMSR